LETSKRLHRLPATEAALRRGDLSRPQADTIADAAVVNPAAERSLLRTAEHSSLSELRQHASRAKAAADPDPNATHRRIHRARRLRRFTDSEGAWNLHARGTVDAGAAFNAALDPIIDELFRAAHRAGRHEPRDAYAFDAVMELARRARGDDSPAATASAPAATGRRATATTATTTAATTGDSPTAGAAPTRRAAPSNPRYLALLRVDLEALVRGRVEGDELCEIAGVGPVPARVARKPARRVDRQARPHQGCRRR
jgi:hypothetical protein